MSPEDLLIFACVNAYRRAFMRLKGLSDIAAVIQHTQDIDWERLIVRARAQRVDFILFSALFLVEKALGIEVPGMVSTNLVKNPIRRKILDRRMRYIMEDISQFHVEEEQQLKRKLDSFFYILALYHANEARRVIFRNLGKTMFRRSPQNNNHVEIQHKGVI